MATIYGNVVGSSKKVPVNTNGTVYSANADYAEIGQWADGNPKGENRIGYFVAIDTSSAGTTMVKATSAADVRGVTVTSPAFVGGHTNDKIDATGNLLPAYAYVAVMGLVEVIDDGTCVVNSRCMPNDNGIAVPSTNNLGYQVIERKDSTHIFIAVEPGADMIKRIKDDIVEINDENSGILKQAKDYADSKDSAIAIAKKAGDDAQADVDALETKVKANADAIDVLNGTGVGSVDKKITDAFNDFATKVSDDDVVNSYKELIDWAATHGAEAAEMAGAITALQNILAGIGGEGESATVVAYVRAAIDALKIGDYAKATDLTALAARVKAIEDKKISTGANKVEKSTTNGNIKIDGTETVVYAHPGTGTNPHGTTASDVGAVPTSRKINGKALSADISLSASDVGSVPKLTYEWNKELTCGSNGLVCLGKFPCYDTNITIDIDSTTSTTYHGTLVIATQNINTTGGGVLKATVYGDAAGTLSSVIKIQYGSGSNVVSVYCNFPGWSKNLIHVRAVALSSTASDVLTSVTSIPTTANITATNALTSKYYNSNNKPTAADIGAAPASHVSDTTIHITADERTAWNAKLDSFTETDPTVPAWAKAASKPSYTKSEVGLGNVDNVKQYSASNPPPYPVTSVNGQTGAVTVEGSKPNTVIIMLSSSAWDSTDKTQTVTATGVLADETVQLIIPTPSIASQGVYYNAGIICTGQAANSLTFKANTVPIDNIMVYVIIQEVTPPPVINFTVYRTSYQAIEGMTWGEWIDSEYCTNSAFWINTNNNVMLTLDNFGLFVQYNNTNQKSTNRIISGREYTIG